MKNTIKLTIVAALALGATSAFATNGDNLIGLGAKARGMGATGIGMSHDSESALLNPAFVKENEVSFGGTIFMPDVSFKNRAVTPDGTGGMQTTGTKYAESDADLSMIPEVSVAVKVNENFSWGIGMFGVAGMGVDYRDDQAVYGANQSQYMGTMAGTNQMLTNLQLMRFAVPLAYHRDNFSIAISPILQYGSLAIAYNNGAYFNAPQTNPANGSVSFTPMNIMTGNGTSQDFGYGFNIGLAYEMQGFTIGAVYTSAIDMEYKNQISSASRNFGVNQGQGFSDNLEQPAEMGVGISYNLDQHTIALDYKQVKWSDAKGYKDFKWEDQNVIALGYQYARDNYAVRVGYNYASNPIKEQTAANMQTDYDGAVINYFNAAGFPATTESHYTIGGTYNITKTIGVDVAYTYAPLVEESYDTSALTQAQVYAATYAMTGDATMSGGAAAASSSEAHVKHSQSAVSVAMTIKF